ncbi:pumilio homolog 12-like isoform X2 [Salvia splendens]|uniref:pumilio homolog 12-like isoform X2 n=1 Tax=Salvia splendens TaxID=180675 RepID=UPI001C257686|nr:pumilio homolog 12-like isoform X2 [Salvia splendens]
MERFHDDADLFPSHEFTMPGNLMPPLDAFFGNPYLQSDSGSHSNSTLLTLGNHNSSPFLNSDLALVESQIARLSLAQSPAFLSPQPNYNDSRRSYAERNGIYEMRQMRVQSAARGFQINSDFEDFWMSNNSAYDHHNININMGYNHHQGANSMEVERYYGRTWRPRQRASLTSLEDLRGKVFAVARDQQGCRFLQSKFEEGKVEDIEMIFMELKDHICELMVDQFGNYLVQKFLAICNHDQMTQLLMNVVSDEYRFMNICVNTHGSVQKLLEYLTTADQRRFVISVLKRITLPLTKDPNGHHVIQYCLKLFTFEEKKHILNVIADHCMEIATDKNGCCVLQLCVEHSAGDTRDRLISEINNNAIMLSEHLYGNYVVQYILGLKIPQATADIITQLRGSFVPLSMSKYGSNVVEKFLKEKEIIQESQRVSIIEEIIYSPHFLRVLQDPYGNYVAQTSFAASKGGLRSAMVSLIQANTPNLHSHPHGKRVLQCIKGNKMRL